MTSIRYKLPALTQEVISSKTDTVVFQSEYKITCFVVLLLFSNMPAAEVGAEIPGSDYVLDIYQVGNFQ